MTGVVRPEGTAASFLAELRERVPALGILEGRDASDRSCDPFKIVPVSAAAILRPRSTAEVSAIMRLAHEAGQKIVVHGGRTGVSGGAYTQADEIVLSLELLNQIESVDPVTQTIVAQAGVPLQAVQEAASANGLYYPVDLGARGTATVGGMLATNAGGNRTLRWGMTRDRVLGVEVVLPDGEILSSMHRLVKNNTGYDLRHLMIGAEGTLGIVTKAVFRTVSAPTTHGVALVALRDYASVLETLAEAQKLPTLSAFELMYADFYRAAVKHLPRLAPLPENYPFYVLIESMGYHPEQDEDLFEQLLDKIYKAGAMNMVLAQSDSQCQALWDVRESVEAVVREISPCLTYDVSLEVADIDKYVTVLHRSLARYPDAKTVVNGHIGDNNIHLGVSIGADTFERADEVDEMVYHPLSDFGGSMSAEHGIGTTKNKFLPVTRNQQEINLMRRLKSSLDPKGILNARVIFLPEPDVG